MFLRVQIVGPLNVFRSTVAKLVCVLWIKRGQLQFNLADLPKQNTPL